MFDIGFSELVLIGVVALIVVGPERLPRVARTAGHMFGRLQRYVSAVKSDISREMQLEELKRMREQLEHSVSHADYEIVEESRKVEQAVSEVAGEVREALPGTATGTDAALPAPAAAAASGTGEPTAAAASTQQPGEHTTHKLA